MAENHLEEMRAQQCGRGNRRGVNLPIWKINFGQDCQDSRAYSYNIHLLSCFVMSMIWLTNSIQNGADLTMGSKVMVKPEVSKVCKSF